MDAKYRIHPVQLFAEELTRAAARRGYSVNVIDNETGAVVLAHGDLDGHTWDRPRYVAAAVRTYESTKVLVSGYRGEMVATVEFTERGTDAGVMYGHELERLLGARD